MHEVDDLVDAAERGEELAHRRAARAGRVGQRLDGADQMVDLGSGRGHPMLGRTCALRDGADVRQRHGQVARRVGRDVGDLLDGDGLNLGVLGDTTRRLAQALGGA